MWVNCLKSLKKLSICLLGITPSAPSVGSGKTSVINDHGNAILLLKLGLKVIPKFVCLYIMFSGWFDSDVSDLVFIKFNLEV